MSVTFDLPDDIADRLGRLARDAGRSPASVLAEALRAAIDDIEDGLKADDVVSRVRSGQERVYSEAEVRRELGLAD